MAAMLPYDRAMSEGRAFAAAGRFTEALSRYQSACAETPIARPSAKLCSPIAEAMVIPVRSAARQLEPDLCQSPPRYSRTEPS